MIIGLGIDVIEVERIRSILERHGKNFLRHVFTDDEQAEAPEGTAAAAAYYAGRWSAKEAVAKALGTGIGQDCYWRNIQVVRWPSGKPAIKLTGPGEATARRLGIARLHVSISHERGIACASVVAEG